jgi:endonuclease/exonuclease/phosphatase family metal-dependent hydrolase
MDIQELINRCDVIALQAMQLKQALLKDGLDDRPEINRTALKRQAGTW